MNEFTPLADSLRSLGDGPSNSLENSIDDFLRTVEASPGFSDALSHVQTQKIFYVSNIAKATTSGSSGEQGGAASARIPSSASIVWFILRRVDGSTKLPILMYIILKEAKHLYQVLNITFITSLQMF